MTNESIPVPCGKCPNCLARRVSAWSFRLMQEDKIARSSYFITLTYDTANVPKTRNNFMTLDKSDVQKFMKRLRKSVSIDFANVTLKYFAVGEYGGKTKRPHYHMILFNVPKLSLIEAAWNLGAIHYGVVSGASVGYTLKYMNKVKRIPAHRNDDRLMEFSLMSKGLGLSYVNEKTVRYHKNDLYNRMCLNIEGGKIIAMPRYYKDKIYTEGQRTAVSVYQKYETIKRLEDRRRIHGPSYDWDVLQSDLAAFRKMEDQAKKRDKL